MPNIEYEFSFDEIRVRNRVYDIVEARPIGAGGDPVPVECILLTAFALSGELEKSAFADHVHISSYQNDNINAR